MRSFDRKFQNIQRFRKIVGSFLEELIVADVEKPLAIFDISEQSISMPSVTRHNEALIHFWKLKGRHFLDWKGGTYQRPGTNLCT